MYAAAAAAVSEPSPLYCWTAPERGECAGIMDCARKPPTSQMGGAQQGLWMQRDLIGLKWQAVSVPATRLRNTFKEEEEEELPGNLAPRCFLNAPRITRR